VNGGDATQKGPQKGKKKDPIPGCDTGVVIQNGGSLNSGGDQKERSKLGKPDKISVWGEIIPPLKKEAIRES